MKYFDSHCHLAATEALADSVHGGARAICGTRPEDWQRIVMAAQNPATVSSIGIHPWFATSSWQEECAELKCLLMADASIGIGETGLDFSSSHANRAEQEASLIAHLEMARELNRPVAVHCVQAWGRMLEILAAHPVERIVFHAYSGSAELIAPIVKLNGWFSFGPAILNTRAKRMRRAVASVPPNRLMVETDAEYAVQGAQLGREQANRLQDVVTEIAALREQPIQDVADDLFSNSCHFFAHHGSASQLSTDSL